MNTGAELLTDSGQSLTSRHLEITFDGDLMRVMYRQCLRDRPVLRLREAELVRRLRRSLKRLGVIVLEAGQQAVTIRVAGESAALQESIARVDHFIDELAVRPLSPRMVVEILGITSKERARWSKNGRLVRCGTATLRAGRIIPFGTYSASQITELAANPAIIESWRHADTCSTGSAR